MRRKKITHDFYMGFNDQKDELERIADILMVLAHPIRLQIVHQLIKKKSLNVKEIQQVLKLPQSTVSQYLNKMRSHKVVAYERKGTEIFYLVDDVHVK